MAVLLYPFQITGSGYLEWARPIPSSRHHQKVALEGRANARRKLAAADPPRPPLMVSFGSRVTDSETVGVPFSIALWRCAHYSIFYSDSETWRCWSGVPSSLSWSGWIYPSPTGRPGWWCAPPDGVAGRSRRFGRTVQEWDRRGREKVRGAGVPRPDGPPGRPC